MKLTLNLLLLIAIAGCLNVNSIYASKSDSSLMHKIEVDNYIHTSCQWEYSVADSAIHYALKGLSIAKRGSLEEQVVALKQVGNAYFTKGEYTKALAYYSELKDIVVTQEAFGFALNRIGLISLQHGDLAEAYSKFDSALIIYKEIGDTTGEVDSYRFMAKLYSTSSNYELTEQYLQKALNKIDSGNSIWGQVQLDRANNFLNNKQYSEAIELFHLVIRHIDKELDQYLYTQIQNQLGYAYLLNNQKITALKHLDIAKEEIDRYQYDRVGKWNQLFYGALYLKKSDLEKAKTYLYPLEKLNNHSALSHFDELLSFYKYQLEKELGNDAQALSELEMYCQLIERKAAMKSSYQQEIATQKLENIERVSSASILEKEQELSGEKQKIFLLKRSQMRIIIFIAVAVFIILFGFIWWQKEINKKRAHLNSLLKEKNKQLAVLHKKILSQKSELSKSDQFKGKLLAIISHDSRSPLNHILSLLPMMENGLINREELSYLTRNIKTKLTDTLNFMDNLLGWTSTQVKGLEMKTELFDVKYLAGESIKVLEAMAESKGVQINNNIESGILVNTDRNMIMLVLRNLTANAIKFCKKGDEIELDIEDYEFEVILRVKDTGVGMSREQLNHLFGKGIHSEIGTEKETGFGLGTLLCREFVERSGGKIWAESEPGKGTTVFFTITRAMEIEMV